MSQSDVYQSNERTYKLGVPAKIDKSPYRFSVDELVTLESTLQVHSRQFGEEAVLVEWGQPIGGQRVDRKYHPKSTIDKLRLDYHKHKLKGICPKAGAVYDSKWIEEQKQLRRKVSDQDTPCFDFSAYIAFTNSTEF